VTEAKDIDWLCAATSIGGLSGVQLPRVLRRIVLASAVDDATFSDETIMAHAAARLRQEGRSVEVTIIGGDDER
jgi:hypothetical protein